MVFPTHEPGPTPPRARTPHGPTHSDCILCCWPGLKGLIYLAPLPSTDNPNYEGLCVLWALAPSAFLIPQTYQPSPPSSQCATLPLLRGQYLSSLSAQLKCHPLQMSFPNSHRINNLLLFFSEPYHYSKFPRYLLSVSLQKEYYCTRTEPLSHSLLNQGQSRLSVPDPILQMMKLRLKKSSQFAQHHKAVQPRPGLEPTASQSPIPCPHFAALDCSMPSSASRKSFPLPLAAP